MHPAGLALLAALVVTVSCSYEAAHLQPREKAKPVDPKPHTVEVPVMVTIVEFNSNGEQTGRATVEKVMLTDEEWSTKLSPEAFSIARRKNTEFAFTGRYNKFYEPGIYRCVACNTALFRSETKFDSGTGWPSFWDAIAQENLYTELDHSFGTTREEVLCRRCDSHLGHLFPDGPPPTGMRYCMNSAALKFEGR